MQSAQIMAAYSLGGADLLRRAMGKKKAEEMAQQRSIFVAGAAKNGIDEKKANEIFDLMEKFAGYGFNKSHAAAYALVAYQTAYLKATTPPHSWRPPCPRKWTTPTRSVSSTRIGAARADHPAAGHQFSSCFRFAPVDEKTIGYGLGAVKGTGEAAMENIVAARRGGPFNDLFDFCHRVDKRVVNRRAIEALIRAGAFDRSTIIATSCIASLDAALGSAEQKARAANQNSLFGDDEAHAMPVQMADVPRWKMREQLAQEKTALGFYLSGHPYQEFAEELSNFVKLKLADVTPDIVAPASGNNVMATVADVATTGNRWCWQAWSAVCASCRRGAARWRW